MLLFISEWDRFYDSWKSIHYILFPSLNEILKQTEASKRDSNPIKSITYSATYLLLISIFQFQLQTNMLIDICNFSPPWFWIAVSKLHDYAFVSLINKSLTVTKTHLEHCYVWTTMTTYMIKKCLGHFIWNKV